MHVLFNFMGIAMFRQRFKLGKKLCFPDVPSTWFWNTLGSIVCQNYIPKSKVLFPHPGGSIYLNNWKSDNDELHRQYRCHLRSFTMKDPYFWSLSYDAAIMGFLDDQARESKYPCFISKRAKALDIEKDKHFDVISWLCEYVGRYDKGYLLRDNGKQVVAVESLRGNNIMICCVYVPIFWKSDEARDMRALPYAASLGNYELVVVPRMRHNWVDDEAAFNHFVSGLPPYALVVPFADTLRRDFLCKSLGLLYDPKYLLVDKEQTVVLPPSHSTWSNDFIPGFPSNDRKYQPHWWKTHSELDDILECNPSDILYTISPGGGRISISKLKQKVVGLYLCTDGQLMRPINLIYNECKARNLEFEVVLLYIPYCRLSDSVANPQLFQDVINRAASIMNISNWWVAPFNDFVSRKIYHVSFDPLQDYDQPIFDQLIILGPHNKFVEPYGRDVMLEYGINGYPFTREHAVERQLEELSSLTLEALLAYGSNNHLCSFRDCSKPSYTDFITKPLTEVQGKIVLLYADYLCNLKTDFYLSLVKWRQRFSEKIITDVEIEVVFVNLEGGKSRADELCQAKLMPGWWCPFDLKHADFITRTLRKNTWPFIAAFGKDGKVISICAQDLLESFGPDDFASYGGLGLRDEVISNIWFWNDHELTMEDIM